MSMPTTNNAIRKPSIAKHRWPVTDGKKHPVTVTTIAARAEEKANQR